MSGLHRRLLVLLLLLLTLPLLAAAALQDEEPNRAVVVVRAGDKQVEARCVSFTEETIDGHELLVRAGLGLVVNATGAGMMVCSIAGEGCPANDCLCQCRGEPCTYWSYWRWREGEWQYAGLGASLTEVRAGDVDGWSWGPGSVTSAISPPEVSVDEVCAAEPVAAQERAPGATSPAGTGSRDWIGYVLFVVIAALLGGAYVLLPKRREQ